MSKSIEQLHAEYLAAEAAAAEATCLAVEAARVAKVAEAALVEALAGIRAMLLKEHVAVLADKERCEAEIEDERRRALDD